MATAHGRMLDVSATVQARRVDLGANALVQVFDGAAQVMLTADALGVLGQMVRDEGVGYCMSCEDHRTVCAAQAGRRFVRGQWQWVCPSCGAPLEGFPF